MARLGDTILFLGSEYNQGHSKNNVHVSMQEQVEHWLKTKENVNPKFFIILEAQLRSLGLIDKNNKMLATIIFDDVSKVLAGGRQSPKDVYRHNVSKSVEFHRAMLEEKRPSIVIIGGSDAYDEYRRQIIGNGYNGFMPNVILKVRNQSSRAHCSTKTWQSHYLSEDIGGLLINFCLSKKSSSLISRPMFLKLSTKCTKVKQEPWSVQLA